MQPVNPMEAQLKQWFDSIDTDRSGFLTAPELKQCMQKCGYAFSDECCKLMINMFDRDGNGRINFQEFLSLDSYIKQMQGGFRAQDADRSGKLDKAEIQRALASSGYNLTPFTIDILMKKLDRGKLGRLPLDGYIELSVFLGAARNIFQRYDPQNTGRATFPFDEYVGQSATLLL
jgi:Ca2+-binding EF-hand superfamily protein